MLTTHKMKTNVLQIKRFGTFCQKHQVEIQTKPKKEYKLEKITLNVVNIALEFVKRRPKKSKMTPFGRALPQRHDLCLGRDLLWIDTYGKRPAF